MCRDCNTERGSGVLFSVALFGTMFVVSLVVFWFAPLLGSILIIGSVGALLVTVGPASIERIARWLSVGRGAKRHG
jgi:hypothetical protein